MNADLVKRIKERLGPDGYLNNKVLQCAMLGAEVALEYAAQINEPEATRAVIQYIDRIRALKS